MPLTLASDQTRIYLVKATKYLDIEVNAVRRVHYIKQAVTKAQPWELLKSAKHLWSRQNNVFSQYYEIDCAVLGIFLNITRIPKSCAGSQLVKEIVCQPDAYYVSAERSSRFWKEMRI